MRSLAADRSRVIPRLHAVTDDAVLERPDFLERARAVLAAGRGAVALHLRGPGTRGRRIFELAGALTESAGRVGAYLYVNDRVDVALTTSAHGLHLGRRSLPVEEARRLVGPELVIGVSTHEVDEAHEAQRAGADYVFVGMVFPSASHPETAPAGATLVTACAGRIRIPVIAIGGITPERVPEVIEAGAHGVAAIRGVWDTASAAGAVETYLNALGVRG